jgi:hypothetical protein
MQKYLIGIILIFSALTKVEAQQLLPLHRHRTIAAEHEMLRNENHGFTALKPLVIADTGNLFKAVYTREGNGKNWFWRKLRYENLIMIENKEFRLTADPVLHFEVSKNQNVEEFLFRNTRGFHVTGRIGKKVAFHSTLYENQVAFQPYVNEFISKNDVIPFAAKYKPYEAPFSQLSPNGYDYAVAEGVISWNTFSFLNIQFGQGKNFVGEGYRSLLLSDNSYSYPHIKAIVTFGKFQYSMMYAEMMDFDLPTTTEGGFHKKRFNMHFLNWQATKWLQVGLFEATIYNPEDSAGYKHFKPNYLNPLILSRTAEYGLNTKNNVILGINWKLDLPAQIQLYGQFVLDEFAENIEENLSDNSDKYGFQIGGKWFDALTIENLYLQGEINSVEPYTYGQEKVSQNYGHARQTLAHPMGANFTEFVSILSYSYGDFELELQANYANYLSDTSLNISGKDIFTSHDNSPIISSVQTFNTNFAYAHAQLSYLLNPRTDMRIYAGAALRKESSDITDSEDVFVFFGLRTFLSNRLFDF